MSYALNMVSRFCERVLLLQNGVVPALGAPDHVTDVYREHVLVR